MWTRRKISAFSIVVEKLTSLKSVRNAGLTQTGHRENPNSVQFQKLIRQRKYVFSMSFLARPIAPSDAIVLNCRSLIINGLIS